ncbi:MAG: GFA family protein, partial [Bdellovibrionota bacterium]
HHQRRSNPNEYGFNVGCLEGVNPFEFGEIPVMDGVNHPSDR